MNNFDLDEKLKFCLTDFHKGGGPEDFHSLLERYVLTYHKLLYRTIKDLDNYFDSDELYCLFDIFNTAIYSQGISAYKFLLWETTDVLEYEQWMIEKWEIDKKVIIEKIKNLSEFQAFAVIMIIYKFWRDPGRYKDNLSLLYKDTVEII
ncbi:hypothetical protein [Clostridium tepidum]|uniref:Uncharacterized protein n=1 Tax=Clostridium tepidum TaxID=1962263 RepID=A0ABX3L0M7_9CLOT|nr:hypothetical protein [Clostridium tepidum]OOO61388.1 hypothetical protein BS637_12635 [Clostridium tepidum]